MNTKQLWLDQIKWLIKCCDKVQFDNCKYEGEYKKAYEKVSNYVTRNISFDEYVQLKLILRKLYLHKTFDATCDHWVSKSLILNDNKVLYTNDDTFYERTSKSENELSAIRNFQNEFISSEIDESQYRLLFTNSGMSAIIFALCFCRMLSKNDTIVIQNDMYYEMYSAAKSIYSNIKTLTIDEIYSAIKNNEALSCVFLGYTKSESNDILSIQQLLTSLSLYSSRNPLFVIIDRTFFSLSDQFYRMLCSNKFNDNVIIISVDSLLKHYQYGLEMTTLGSIFLYSSKCRSKTFNYLLNSLYNSLGIRLSSVLYSRLIPFNKSILHDSFIKACENADMFCNVLEGETSARIKMADGDVIVPGDIVYFTMDNIKRCSDIIGFLSKQGVVISGQSFGLDTTRICCEEDYLNHSIRLRLSFGLEDEESICKLAKLFKKATQKY